MGRHDRNTIRLGRKRRKRLGRKLASKHGGIAHLHEMLTPKLHQVHPRDRWPTYWHRGIR